MMSGLNTRSNIFSKNMSVLPDFSALYSVQYSSYIIFKNRSTHVAIEVHGMTFNAFWASGSILISTIAAIM